MGKREEISVLSESRRIIGWDDAVPLLNLVSDAVMVTDHEGRIEAVNDELVRRVGRSREDLIGQHPSIWREKFQQADLSKLIVDACRENGCWLGEVEYTHPDGGKGLSHVNVTAITDAEGRFIGCLSISRDVTEGRQLRQAVEGRERTLELAASLAGLGYYVYDLVGDEFEVLSQQHVRNYGLPRETFLERVSRAGDFDPGLVDEADRARVGAALKRAEAGETVELEYRIPTEDGVNHLHAFVSPLRDENGAVTKLVAASLDVTRQRQEEAERLHSQRLETVGRLAGGVAHDFNNLLAVILGNAEMLKNDPDGPERVEMLRDIIQASLRGRDLVADLLQSARQSRLSPQRFEVGAAAERIVSMLRRTLPVGVVIDFRAPTSPVFANADPGRFDNALLNLATNAAEAMKGAGALTIAVRAMAVEDAGAARILQVSRGDYVVVEVADTGPGFDQEAASHLFEPFYTTRGSSGGSGLGLAMVDGFARQSGGAVRAHGAPGVGSRFEMILPSSEPLAAADPLRPTLRVVPPARARILLAEDDEAVMRVASQMLRDAGYEVVEAADGASAAARLKAGQRFNLLVSDVAMPGPMQGTDLARVARAVAPSMPVLLVTGYAAAALDAVGEGVATLQKPASRTELLAKVAELIAARPAAQAGAVGN